MMQPIIAIVLGLLLIGFIVFAFRQGEKVTSDREGNGTNNDTNQLPGGF
jgi:cbb3-type cytochrome oxidase subunit 3